MCLKWRKGKGLLNLVVGQWVESPVVERICLQTNAWCNLLHIFWAANRSYCSHGALRNLRTFVNLMLL